MAASRLFEHLRVAGANCGQRGGPVKRRAFAVRRAVGCSTSRSRAPSPTATSCPLAVLDRPDVPAYNNQRQ